MFRHLQAFSATTQGTVLDDNPGVQLQSRILHLGPELGITGYMHVTHPLAAEQQMPRRELGSKSRI